MARLTRLCEDGDVWGYDPEFSVEEFLRCIGSPRVADLPEFARWVEEAARRHDINQRMLLAIAQKEQSFLTRRRGGPGWRRALMWTMGYGATDAGDIPRYSGTKTQVFAAAAGLRRYRDKGMAARLVGRRLGDTLAYVRGPTADIVPENEATAALYLYTPHVSGARTFLRVWAWLRKAEERCRRRRQRVVSMAWAPLYENGYPRPLRRTGRVDEGHVAYWFGRPCDTGQLVSHRVPVLGRVYVHRRVAEAFERVFADIAEAGLEDEIDLSDYGGTYCCRRVRGGRSYSPHAWGIAIDLNVHHLQAGNIEFRHASRSNWRCRPDEIPRSLQRLAPFFRRWGFSWGGDWKSLKDPMHFEATAITVRLLEGGDIPEAFYRACRAPEGYQQRGYRPGPVKVVLLPESKVVDCGARLDEDGVTRCALRPLLEALGWTVYDHIPDQGKVYLVPPRELRRGGGAEEHGAAGENPPDD